jgi:hypothetical protein
MGKLPLSLGAANRTTSAILTFTAACATMVWAGAVHAQAYPAAAQAFPATGQTTSYVAGDDGDIQAGATLGTDNGDGTIIVNDTKLVWEEKDRGDGSLHNVNNTYWWAGTSQAADFTNPTQLTPCQTSEDCNGVPGTSQCTAIDGQGARMTTFLWVTQLSAAAFAGHTDRRVSNVKELQSIADFSAVNRDQAPTSSTHAVRVRLRLRSRQRQRVVRDLRQRHHNSECQIPQLPRTQSTWRLVIGYSVIRPLII